MQDTMHTLSPQTKARTTLPAINLQIISSHYPIFPTKGLLVLKSRDRVWYYRVLPRWSTTEQITLWFAEISTLFTSWLIISISIHKHGRTHSLREWLSTKSITCRWLSTYRWTRAIGPWQLLILIPTDPMASIIVDSWRTRCSSFERALMFSSIWVDIEHPVGTGYSGVGDLDETVLQYNSWAIGSIICGRTCGEDVFSYTPYSRTSGIVMSCQRFLSRPGSRVCDSTLHRAEFLFSCVSVCGFVSPALVCVNRRQPGITALHPGEETNSVHKWSDCSHCSIDLFFNLKWNLLVQVFVKTSFKQISETSVGAWDLKLISSSEYRPAFAEMLRSRLPMPKTCVCAGLCFCGLHEFTGCVLKQPC